MRNVLLVAGPVTDPHRFMAELGTHPDIAAVPPVTLGNALHAVARRAVDAATDGRRSGEALLTHAREEGGAALASYFARLRSATGRSVIVLHDPSGPMFPFLNPPGVDLLVLTRDAAAAAQAVGGGGISRVVEAARRALDAFERRVAGFGLSDDRIMTVDEDRLRREPETGWPEICRMLGVDAGADAVASMVRADLTPWSLRGARI
jgi:hypothetical protein